jgi:cell wall-associated NlpC family hydrolase
VSEESIRYIAFKFLNTAYLWGGRTVWGIDCSGYVQMVYKFFGIQLMRDAYMQSAQGDAVGFLEEVHCGDLAFFEDDERKIIHVGLLLNSNQVIHASGKVRVDIIDNQGIVNSDTGERTHQLRIIKRLKNISSL